MQGVAQWRTVRVLPVVVVVDRWAPRAVLSDARFGLSIWDQLKAAYHDRGLSSLYPNIGGMTAVHLVVVSMGATDMILKVGPCTRHALFSLRPRQRIGVDSQRPLNYSLWSTAIGFLR
jgi:hypothetical protein